MKAPKQEIEILERIFMLNISRSFLEQGRRPFHNEAIRIIDKKIKQLKQTNIKTKKHESIRTNSKT